MRSLPPSGGLPLRGDPSRPRLAALQTETPASHSSKSAPEPPGGLAGHSPDTRRSTSDSLSEVLRRDSGECPASVRPVSHDSRPSPASVWFLQLRPPGQPERVRLSARPRFGRRTDLPPTGPTSSPPTAVPCGSIRGFRISALWPTPPASRRRIPCCFIDANPPCRLPMPSAVTSSRNNGPSASVCIFPKTRFSPSREDSP